MIKEVIVVRDMCAKSGRGVCAKAYVQVKTKSLFFSAIKKFVTLWLGVSFLTVLS